MSRLRRWQTEEGDAYVVSLVRAIWGVLLLAGGLREAPHELRDPYFADVFHMPLLPEALVPGRGVFVALVVLQLVLAVLIAIGWFARPALLATAVIGLYLLFCDRLGYHNNRYALFLFAFLLAFAPCDRAFVWRRPALPPELRKGPLWAARLSQIQFSLIYLASGGSKWLDPDWREGRVIGDRLTRSASIAVAKGVPRAIMDTLSDPALASAFAKLAIATELLLAVALFVSLTRPFALWWGVMFHLTIEVTSQVELFTWLTLTVYALFAVPALRERAFLYDPSAPWGRWAARLARGLDWLARFDVRADEAATAGRGFVIVDRDGSRASGLGAYAKWARATPLFFPLFVPLWVLARVFSSGPADARAAAC